MADVIKSAKFHEPLIFDLIELSIQSRLDAGIDIRCDIPLIGMLRRAAGTTEGSPSEFVQEISQTIFLRDIWAKLPAHERRPGVFRCFQAEELEWASRTE